MRPEVLLLMLETKQGEIARQAMEQPAGLPEGYYRACGIYAGLDLARQIILDAMRDEHERDI